MTLLSNVKTLRTIASTFCGLLRKPELYFFWVALKLVKWPCDVLIQKNGDIKYLKWSKLCIYKMDKSDVVNRYTVLFHKLHPFFKLQLHADLKTFGIMSEDCGRFLLPQNRYSKLLSWAENLNKLFAVKFKFSAQDRDLEYFFLEK